MEHAKYLQIYSQLLQKIENSEYPSNSYLPSENELMSEYHASRDTIRKALNLLLQNGYIQKQKGKGSIVLEFDKIDFPISGLTSFKELAPFMGHESTTQVITLKKIAADENLKQKLYMNEGEVYVVERVRTIENERVIIDIDYLNAQIVPNITEKIAGNSLYEYIENELGLKISFARKEVTVKPVTKQDKELLDLNGFDMVVSIVSYTYLEDATLFQYTESRHRPDKFRFVEFARRTKQ